jgi:hypothetical protein
LDLSFHFDTRSRANFEFSYLGGEPVILN